jgi:hypothetical protein
MNLNGSGFSSVMAEFDPALHDFLPQKQDVDGRVEPGHDEEV